MSTASEMLDLVWRRAPHLMRVGGGGLKIEGGAQKTGWKFGGHMKPVELARIKAMYADGMSIRQIAKELGRSYGAIATRTRLLVGANVDRRTSRKAAKGDVK
jgi:hypothetical protein